MWQKLVFFFCKWRITYISIWITFHTNMIKSNEKLIFNLYNIMRLVLESDHQFGNKRKFWTIFEFVKYWNMWDVRYLIMNFTRHPLKFGFLHFAWFYLSYIMWLFMFCMFFSKRTSFSIFCIFELNSNSTQFPRRRNANQQHTFEH